MPEAARILYNESLVQSWESSLGSAFARPHIRLTRRSSRAVGRFNVVVDTGDRSFQAVDADESLPVVALRTVDVPAQMFWFAFKASFDLWDQGRHLLEHASVALFQNLSVGELIPMFRAEWDSRAAGDSSSNHAQPHWHFVQGGAQIRAMFGRLETSGSERSTFDVETARLNLSDGVTELIDFSGFHFAMSPLWTSGAPGSHKQVFQSDVSLNAWFRNLTLYIADQLSYVSKRNRIPLLGSVRKFGSDPI
jgi:hypothetical protein